MNPSVSIVIPCYNHGHFLPEAIASIEKFPDPSIYEIIIVNDGSTDEATLQMLKQLKQKGYRVLDQQNQGLAIARNNGIEISKGEYILPLDADNKIRPDYISKGLPVLESRPEVGIVYGDSMLFGEQNKLQKTGKFNRRQLLDANYIDACVLLRREVWKRAGGYDPRISPLADWDMNLCAVEQGWQFHYIPEVLFDYRYRKDSMIRTYTNGQECIEYIARKHGVLYRQFLLEQISIKTQLKTLWGDIWKKMTG